MVNLINILGLTGLTCSAFGPLWIILVNVADIWRYKIDTDQLDRLEQAHDQVLKDGVSPNNPSFEALYSLIDEDLPPRETIDRIWKGGVYGVSGAHLFCDTENGREHVMSGQVFERFIESHIEDLREKGRHRSFLVGMMFLLIGFGFQAIAYLIQNPVI